MIDLPSMFPRSRSSKFWSRLSGASSSSTHRRRPRDGYIQRIFLHIRRLLRELYSYARRHPAKVLSVVIALVSGGVFHALARSLDFSLPNWVSRAGKGARGGHDAWSRFDEEGLGSQSMLRSAINIASGFI